jgi:hypothetical protein
MRRALLREILQNAVRKGLEDDVAPDEREARILGNAWVAFLIENEWSIVREDERTVFRVGLPGAERTRIVKPAQGSYDRAPATLRADEIAARFKEFCKRD